MYTYMWSRTCEYLQIYTKHSYIRSSRKNRGSSDASDSSATGVQQTDERFVDHESFAQGALASLDSWGTSHSDGSRCVCMHVCMYTCMFVCM